MAVNPDEAVAYGAAIQGSILSGARGLNEDLVLIDVCPFTLGITTSDNQKSVLIQVYQGENNLMKENALLGTFKLTGIPVAARGVPQIEVVFVLDENGILVVSARDQDSGTSESIIITSENGQLDTSEINHMMREAQDFASQDKMRKEQSRALNELQQMISTLHVDLAQQLDHDAHRSTLEFLNGQAEWAESFGASMSTEELRL
ncbi:ATPase with role in protein import into the ER [Ceratobasidium sp. 423]|nr:ATPase with role in protein import into the ER [Ceratobasidium sp. 423]